MSWSIPQRAALFAALLCLGACAAPAEADDDVSAGGQAATLDEGVARLSEMKASFADVKLEAVQDLPFDDKPQPTRWIAKVGFSGPTMCVLALLPNTPATRAVIPKVPRGDVYAVDASEITLARRDGYLVWTFPMLNDKTQAGDRGAAADFVLECTGSKAPELASIETALRRGWSNDGAKPLLAIVP